ncbi:putative hydroxypyruvate reductase [Pseudovibrio axinellae]|uniref:Putative hydroxypyruvate reductase n=1 Tax=Pseudovibrio axinellae TaxID=989403 RepID=A0A165YW53_9HYPH|nr:glycerate kinase [Pseudovibrio axinellae]KZL19289.1 putative hydroxypyruvate reductase [Pseudovibrio axinellae]SEQ42717.1 glycerate 2-kinase [Pseudovibrio axinellae]
MVVDPKQFLSDLFDAAVASAQPDKCIPQYLPDAPKGRLIVIGAGKASAAMARAVEDNWAGELSGLVITRYGYNVPCRSIEIIEAAHPVPDEAGLNGAKRMLELVSDLSEDDTVLCLISGGGSSLLPLPYEGLSLEDKQSINKELLSCGATISEMNCVRRHLSQIKGGRLAVACHPATVINLLISDVPGDDPINIASGPTVGDPTTCADAIAIVERYKLTLPDRAWVILQQGLGETPDMTDPRLSKVQSHMIAAPQIALEAAALIAQQQGIPAYILGDSIEGEACDVGIVMAGIAKQVARYGQPFQAPCVLLSGGETTVTLTGDGRGGRNVEFLLSFAIAMDRQKDVYALAGDTDGVDGVEEIAGAYCDPSCMERAWAQETNPRLSLSNNDGHGFFEALGDSIITGPTLTNVNDFRAIFIAQSDAVS